MRVLHTLPELDGGGADRVIFDYSIRMIPNIQFDFIVHSEKEGILEDELKKKGCNVIHIKPARNGLLQYYSSICKVLEDGKYDIIHVSQGFWGYAFIHIARLKGIKIRIAHAHMANIPENKVKKMLRMVFRRLTIWESTDLFACGEDAAIWMWGKKNYCSGRVHIMTNGVDAQKFKYSVIERNKLRKEFGVEDKYVIGNVGRLAYQKNQSFLLEVFKIIHDQIPNSVLFIVGGGDLELELIEKAIKLNIRNSVRFLGIRSDVNKLLNMMDVFVLPSLFEGFPITVIESQMNGLPVVVSTEVTKESLFSDNCREIKLSSGAEIWAKEIIYTRKERCELPDEIMKQRDMDYLAHIQEKWYLERINDYGI